MTTKSYRFDVVPVAAPRMTRSDKWNVRPIVARYRAFKDALRQGARALNFELPPYGATIVFFLPMPKSWSKRKKEEMAFTPHQMRSRNDSDNLIKGVFDALCPPPKGDGHIYDYRVSKYWDYEGHVDIWVDEMPPSMRT